MRFWPREILGWLLVALGLYVFLAVYSVLMTPATSFPRLLESGPLTVIGFVVFRGGIHLLKVATAARVCLHAQAESARRLDPSRETSPAPPPKKKRVPLDW